MEHHRQSNKSAGRLNALGVDGAPPANRRPGRKKSDNTPAAQVRRKERIAEALDYRRQGFTYRQIAAQMGVSLRTAYAWVQEGYDATPRATSVEWAKVILDRCDKKKKELMARLRAGDISASVIDSLLQVQARILQIHGIRIDQAGEGEAVHRRAAEIVIGDRIHDEAEERQGQKEVDLEAWRARGPEG